MEHHSPCLLFLIAAGVLTAGSVAYYTLMPSDGHAPASDQSMSGQADENFKTPASEEKDRSDVFLYFANPDNEFLIAEKRRIVHSKDPAAFGREILHELIAGPRNKLVRTLPPKTILNAFYIADKGTAYADFSEEIKDNHAGGSQSEYLTVYSIVNSISFTFVQSTFLF